MGRSPAIQNNTQPRKICLSSLQFSKIMREQSAAKPRPDNFHPVKSLKYLIVEIKSRKTCSLDECLL
jgi:hypothetical protein